MPGSRFKEFIDRAFLGNRGYNYQTGQWNRDGVNSGLIGGIGNALVPGLGTIGRIIYDHRHNVGKPTQYTGGLSGGYSYQPPDYSGMLNGPDLNPRVGDGNTGIIPPSMGNGWTNYGSYVETSTGTPGWQNGYGAGNFGQSDGSFTPSTTTLYPGPNYQPIDFPLNGPDLNVHTGNGSGNSYGGFSGNSSGGTLGGGTVVDPSAWGMFGLGGDGGEQDSTGRVAATSTGRFESGGGLAGLMAKRRPPQTGGGGQIAG